MRAALYCRVSTIHQEPGTSLESQRAACRRLADELGAVVVAEYQDIDSGAKENIPGLLDMVESARRGDFDVVLVDHPDRFSRNLTKKVLYRRDLARTGVDIRYAAMRLDDTAEGRLMENMAAVISEYERERITFRTNRGRYAKAQSGRVVGTGRPPYGYEYVRDGDTITSLQPDPVTAPIITRILTELLDDPAQSIAARLNAESIPPPRGKRWHEASILKMARNPVYSGHAAYGQWAWAERKIVAPRPAAEWVYTTVPALIGQDVWERLQVVIADRRMAGRPRLTDDPYLLRGTLRCGHCGGLIATHTNAGIRYYACLRRYRTHAQRQRVPVCELATIRADALEDLIIGSIRALLLDEQLLRAGLHREMAAQRAVAARERPSGIERDLERHQRRLSNIHTLLVDAQPGSAAWRDLTQRAADTQAQITRLESERDQHAEASVLTDESIETLAAFAGVIRDELDTDGSSWPLILKVYRVRVTVRNGTRWKIGRHHAFDLDISAAIPIELRHRKNVFSNIDGRHTVRIPVRRAG